MLASNFGNIGKFLTSGLILNLAGLMLFHVLVQSGIIGEYAAVYSSLTLLPIAYAVNRRFVFEAADNSRKSGRKFLITYSLVMGANYIVLKNVLFLFPGKETLVQICFLGMVVIGSFLAQKHWVFKKRI